MLIQSSNYYDSQTITKTISTWFWQEMIMEEKQTIVLVSSVNNVNYVKSTILVYNLF